MKITSFYYLNYPDKLPEDKYNAYSEVYVEVSEDASGSIDEFDYTYSFHVYTLRYINDLLLKNDKKFLVDRSVIIVEKFEDWIIEKALESILSHMDHYGVKKT